MTREEIEAEIEDLDRKISKLVARQDKLIDKLNSNILVGREMPIESLGLPVRVDHALRYSGFQTVQDIIDCQTSIRLGGIRNFGKVARGQLTEAMRQAGYDLDFT